MTADRPLVPTDADDLSMVCTCPDWQVPCKHLAAVFYLLAERFDEDPFAIPAWRGRDRDDLRDTLSALRTGGVTADRLESPHAAAPLTESLDSFFALQTDLPHRGVAATPADAVLDQVPAVDVTVGGTPLIQLLRPVYLALGSSPTARRDDPG